MAVAQHLNINTMATVRAYLSWF